MLHSFLLDAASSTATYTSFWDKNILNLVDGIKGHLDKAMFVQGAKNIAAILSLIYLSVKAYAVILGEGKLEIMPLFRPFLITLVIVNFGLFAHIIGSVGHMLDDSAKEKFLANTEKIDNLLLVKHEKRDSIVEIIDRVSGKLQNQLAAQSKQAIESSVGFHPMAGIESQIGAWLTIKTQIWWSRASMWLQEKVMWVVISLMKGVMYCLFFMQMIFLHILLILGPISFAFSIIGAFGNSWIEWVKRYISVSFWSVIGFIVMDIVTAIIGYGLKQEIHRLGFILDKGKHILDLAPGQIADASNTTATFFAYLTHIDNFLGFLLIGLLTAIGGIAATPLVSSWIIGGATNTAMKGMHSGGSRLAGKAAAVASGGTGLAVKGAGAVGGAVKGIASKGASFASKISSPPQQRPPSKPS